MIINISIKLMLWAGWLCLGLANVLSFLCIQDNFSGGDKSGLGSVIMFIPVVLLCIFGFALGWSAVKFGQIWWYILPGIVVLDVARKLVP